MKQIQTKTSSNANSIVPSWAPTVITIAWHASALLPDKPRAILRMALQGARVAESMSGPTDSTPTGKTA